MLVLTGSVSLAGVNETISDCASSETQDVRIACLEDALRQLADGGSHAPAVSADIRSQQEPIPDNLPAPVAEPAQPAVEAARIPEPSSLPVAPPDSAATASDQADVAELGAEQVEVRNRTKSDDETIVSATVVDFDFVGYRRLVVQLDNGQIWRQIDGDRTSVERGLRNEKTFEVELWGTGLGGYRMRIVPVNRTIRVERVK